MAVLKREARLRVRHGHPRLAPWQRRRVLDEHQRMVMTGADRMLSLPPYAIRPSPRTSWWRRFGGIAI
jgi:hypothetical protein